MPFIHLTFSVYEDDVYVSLERSASAALRGGCYHECIEISLCSVHVRDDYIKQRVLQSATTPIDDVLWWLCRGKRCVWGCWSGSMRCGPHIYHMADVAVEWDYKYNARMSPERKSVDTALDIACSQRDVSPECRDAVALYQSVLACELLDAALEAPLERAQRALRDALRDDHTRTASKLLHYSLCSLGLPQFDAETWLHRECA